MALLDLVLGPRVRTYLEAVVHHYPLQANQFLKNTSRGVSNLQTRKRSKRNIRFDLSKISGLRLLRKRLLLKHSKKTDSLWDWAKICSYRHQQAIHIKQRFQIGVFLRLEILSRHIQRSLRENCAQYLEDRSCAESWQEINKKIKFLRYVSELLHNKEYLFWMILHYTNVRVIIPFTCRKSWKISSGLCFKKYKTKCNRIVQEARKPQMMFSWICMPNSKILTKFCPKITILLCQGILLGSLNLLKLLA